MMDGTFVQVRDYRVAVHIWPVEMSESQKRELNELLKSFIIKHWTPDKTIIANDFEE